MENLGKKNKKLQGEIVLKYFKVIKKIGSGAFGQIFQVEYQKKGGEFFALKAESVKAKNPQLVCQSKLYKELHQHEGVVGIPKVYSSSVERGYNLMLMEMLGKSLEDIFAQRFYKFSLKTVLQIGIQVLQRIQYLHHKGFIHRDIKPQNLLMGTKNKQNIIYLIDMGLSKKYLTKQKKHIKYRQGKQMAGTARYASIRTHIGIEQSRRDDIQTLGYVLMYFLKGILPWQNMKQNDLKTKYEMITHKKQLTSLEVLCEGFPSEFEKFIAYSKSLEFQEKPNYQYLKGLLKDVAKNNEMQINMNYDWTEKKEN